MEKIDLKEHLKQLYNLPAKEVSVVDVPPMNFLMIDGAGNPNTSAAYSAAVETLYILSYTLKFMVKKSEIAIDYTVMPLEGLWWADDMTQFQVQNKDTWKWTAMIMQPEYVTSKLFERARRDAEKKKGSFQLPSVRFESFHEGPAVQIMHIGPFEEEGPTIKNLHTFIEKHDWKLKGKHHEIYLSDPRRTPAQKLRTVIRQPYEA